MANRVVKTWGKAGVDHRVQRFMCSGAALRCFLPIMERLNLSAMVSLRNNRRRKCIDITAVYSIPGAIWELRYTQTISYKQLKSKKEINRILSLLAVMIRRERATEMRWNPARTSAGDALEAYLNYEPSEIDWRPAETIPEDLYVY